MTLFENVACDSEITLERTEPAPASFSAEKLTKVWVDGSTENFIVESEDELLSAAEMLASIWQQTLKRLSQEALLFQQKA